MIHNLRFHGKSVPGWHCPAGAESPVPGYQEPAFWFPLPAGRSFLLIRETRLTRWKQSANRRHPHKKWKCFRFHGSTHRRGEWGWHTVSRISVAVLGNLPISPHSGFGRDIQRFLFLREKIPEDFHLNATFRSGKPVGHAIEFFSEFMINIHYVSLFFGTRMGI